MRRRLATIATALSAAVVLSSCSAYDLPLPGGADVGDDPMTINVMFRDVLDLVPQSTVKVDDVTVGRVTDITLRGYTADVTIKVPKTLDLPQNTRAEIRQTSLLGEKFVSLSKPTEPRGKLSDGDTLGLDQTGRNPEVEEVFSALALLLNGGGVAQLKTIATELNKAFGGREPQVRSIIRELGTFTGQLAANKTAIVNTLENVNRLATELRRQDGTIKSTLDQLPAAIRSVNGQRQDLVRMLQALQTLSTVGVRVIEASKESVVDTLRDLAPVLESFARAGSDLPDSLQVFLTYPFVDAAVGNDPKEAARLPMGDFTNLSVNLDLDLFNLPNLPGLAPGVSLADVFGACKKSILSALCRQAQRILDPQVLRFLCGPLPLLCRNSLGSGGGGAPNSNGGSGSGTGGGLLGGLLGRAAPDVDGEPQSMDPFALKGTGYDPGLGTLLLQGMAVS